MHEKLLGIPVQGRCATGTAAARCMPRASDSIKGGSRIPKELSGLRHNHDVGRVAGGVDWRRRRAKIRRSSRTFFAPASRRRAIIVPPQAGILAVGAITDRVVAVNGQADMRPTIAVRPIVTLTLSSDHRVIDGAGAAAFLADVVREVETSS